MMAISFVLSRLSRLSSGNRERQNLGEMLSLTIDKWISSSSLLMQWFLAQNDFIRAYDLAITEAISQHMIMLVSWESGGKKFSRSVFGSCHVVAVGR